MNVREERPGGRQRLATIIHTRPYGKTAVMRSLMEESCSVTEQAAGPEALEFVLELVPDVIILVIDPDVEVWPLSSTLSEALRRRPVIGLVPDDTRGIDLVLDRAATVCLRDTEISRALPAQLRALFRLEIAIAPTEGEEDEETMFSIGDLEVDMGRMRATYRGTPLGLGPSVTSILGHLVREAGHIVAPVTLLDHAHRRTHSESDAQIVVRQYIRRIRRALEAAGGPPDLVVNVRGFGYMVEPPDAHRPRTP